jgi:hypothetical protein
MMDKLNLSTFLATFFLACLPLGTRRRSIGADLFNDSAVTEKMLSPLALIFYRSHATHATPVREM